MSTVEDVLSMIFGRPGYDINTPNIPCTRCIYNHGITDYVLVGKGSTTHIIKVICDMSPEGKLRSFSKGCEDFKEREE